MNDTQYAFAVSSVRFKENELPPQSFFYQLNDANSYKEAVSLLKDKDFDFEKSDDISGIINEKTKEMYEYLKEILPDKNALDFLIVKNDFHNLKASLKSIMTNEKNPPFIYPCITEPNEILKAMKNKEFDMLPKFLSECAKKSYELLTSSKDGRLTELYIDKKALEMSLILAKKTNNELSKEIANNMVAFSNIKIAIRLSATRISNIIYDYAFIPCEDIDISMLKSAVQKGKDEVFRYVESTPFSYLCQYKNSTLLLEKKSEEENFKLLKKAELISFGCEPLIAYYMKFDATMKNIRIVLSGKKVGINKDVIKERIRELYV